MTLRQRMEAARAEYRRFPASPSGAGSTMGTPVVPPRPQRRPTHRRMRFAAVALAAAVLAILVWVARPDGRTSVESAGPAEGSGTKDPDPPGAIARTDDRVALDPPGPFTDGQRVRVSVPDRHILEVAGAPELVARQCAVVADDPRGPDEWCDPSPVIVPNEDRTAPDRDPTWLTVRVRRVVFTPTGDRDCEDPAVTCRIVLRAPIGDSDIAGPVLRFTGPATPAPARAALDGRDGSVLLTTRGVTPHPSWSEVAASDPELAARYPLTVVLCAFGVPQPPSDPTGALTVGLPAGDPGRHVPSPTCGSRRALGVLDVADPSRPVPLEVPTGFAATGGWIDCRTDACYLEVVATRFERGDTGEVRWAGDEVAARVIVEPRHLDRRREPPSVRVLTPGPHRPGSELRLEVSGLSAAEDATLAVCVSGRSLLDCVPVGSSSEPILDGEHLVRLPDGPLPADRSDLYYLLVGNPLEDRPLAVAPLELAP